MRKIVIFALLVALSACSSYKTQEIKEENKISRFGFQSMQANISVSPDFPDFKQSFVADVQLSAYDSVALTAFGPFGITVGKLYATPDKFIFYNIFENTCLTGAPTSENFNKAVHINLSFADIIAFLRNEPTFEPEKYRKYEENEKQIIYTYSNVGKFAEFVVYSKEKNAIVQYQRKNAANELELNVFLENFKKFSGYNLASKLTFKFPSVDGSLIIELEKAEIDKPTAAPFQFKVPNSAKKYVID